MIFFGYIFDDSLPQRWLLIDKEESGLRRPVGKLRLDHVTRPVRPISRIAQRYNS
jgi:hypothetical protein